MPKSNKKLNPHFFRREPDGSVRLRLRFSQEEATAIEEAAGQTPVLSFIHDVINTHANEAVRERRARRNSTTKENK